MKELIFSVTKNDLKITWFSGTGNGGMNKNAHHKCCRIQHPDSGVIVVGQEERSREQNLRNAFLRLTRHPKFKTWLRLKTASMLVDKEKEREEINRKVDEALKEKNLRVEFLDPNE